RGALPLGGGWGGLDAGSASGRQGGLLGVEGPTVEDDAHAAAVVTERPLARKREQAVPIETLPPLRYCSGTSMPGSGKALVVQKYGGTSVGDVERIRNVARRALAAKKAGNDVVVVVSAMAGETNRLLKLTSALAKRPDQREQDVVVSTGEQVSVGLLALAIQEL